MNNIKHSMLEAYAQFPALPQRLGVLDTYATKTVFPSITLLLDYLSQICMKFFLSPPVPIISKFNRTPNLVDLQY